MLRHGLGSDALDVQRLNDIIAPHAAFVKGPLRSGGCRHATGWKFRALTTRTLGRDAGRNANDLRRRCRWQGYRRAAWDRVIIARQRPPEGGGS